MVSNNQNSSSAKWWESAEDHRFALEVLQLGIRRKMLKFIYSGVRTKLEKALVIDNVKGGYKATPTGLLYLEHVEFKR